MRPEAQRPSHAFTQALIQQDNRLHIALTFANDSVMSRIYRPMGIGESQAANAVQLLVQSGLPEAGAVRKVDREKFQEVREFLAQPGRKLIIMRHGTQQLNAVTRNLQGALQKIRMMQPLHNRLDPLTSASIAESAGTAVLFRFTEDALRKNITVVASQNMRAAQVAGIIADIANAPASYNPILNCIEYPSPEEKSDEEILTLLGGESSNGTPPWEEVSIDTVSRSGRGTYRTITSNITELIAQTVDDGSEDIVIAVTHAQQYAAAVQVARQLTVVDRERPDELGFLVFAKGTALVCSTGFYQKAA